MRESSIMMVVCFFPTSYLQYPHSQPHPYSAPKFPFISYIHVSPRIPLDPRGLALDLFSFVIELTLQATLHLPKPPGGISSSKPKHSRHSRAQLTSPARTLARSDLKDQQAMSDHLHRSGHRGRIRRSTTEHPDQDHQHVHSRCRCITGINTIHAWLSWVLLLYKVVHGVPIKSSLQPGTRVHATIQDLSPPNTQNL